ncbi:hypothetical protein [Acinetobacter bereziniae]|uniref:hypothetical protein n=1 Tax=Acinetobacter bereziniae TaxID=106648 RepID=UPI0012500FF3|nr:hypothetical protein [Acinetobacter bereziniae]
MHSPRPYGLAIEGGELTNQDRLFIDSIAKKATNFKQVSQLENVKFTRALPDGGYVIVYDQGGIFKAIAYKEQGVDKESHDGFAPTNVPMLFSAIINDGRSFLQNGIELTLTDMCCRRVGNYSGVTASKAQTLKRFAIGFNPQFRELRPEIADHVDESKTLYTQYTAQYPTWYSGAMAEVMQIVAGFGKQNLQDLPRDFIEQAVFEIPENYLNKIKTQLGDVRLPAYTGLPDRDGQFQYSYKFNKTHLISFDTENNPWLILIEPSNVWAMPLPMIPATTTAEFREYVDYVGDHELEEILNRFGGVPSGEAFPAPDTFYSWVRAGVIIKVCDTSDYYKFSAYTSACGWSTNLQGSSAINTCYDVKGQFYYGYTYMLSLQMGVAKNRGMLSKTSIKNLTSDQLKQISNYISGLHTLLIKQEDVRLACLMYKLRRIDFKDLLAMSVNQVTNSDIEYLDNLVLSPIAGHSGQMVRTNEGYIYDGICLKLPEPILKGCISMVWKPIIEEGQAINHPKCDTIVFGYYIGNDLKVIKSFHDERKHINDVQGNFEDDMTVGSWEQVETQGLSGLNGDYYSTDFDDRKEFAPVTITTRIIGKDIGYGKPRARYWAHFQMDGILTRTRYYTHQTNVSQTQGQFMRNAFVVNYFNRNMCTYFKRHSFLSTQSSESYKRLEALDPNSYKFWTYDEGMHWIDIDPDPEMKKTGKPYPKDSHPVWAEVRKYNPYGTALSDFADQGDWIGGLPADVTKYVNPPGGATGLEYGGEPPSVEEYVDTFAQGAKHDSVCYVSILERPELIHKNPHSDSVYLMSPDENNTVLDQNACKVLFGTSTYANIELYGESNRYRFGYSKLADHKSAHFFIGVINE